MTTLSFGEEKAHIEGSNTFGEELGPALIKAYQVKHPETVIELGSDGTGTGLTALLNGTCDVAAASRVANEDEHRLARARKLRLSSHFIGTYGVSVITHERNPIRALSDRQVRDIFTGKITNWKDVGGRDAPIHLYIRDASSGTQLGFRELAMADLPYAASVKTFLSYPDIIAAVADDPNGIGYTGMTKETPKGVRTLLINGIPANSMAVNEGLYPYARGLRFYTVNGRGTTASRSFIRFVRGTEGQAILEQMGYVPRAMQRMDPASLAP